MKSISSLLIVVGALAAPCPTASAQDNYEIQVYSYELVPKGMTMVEIHSNFTVDGEKNVVNGVQPSNHAMHETLEITRGWTDWFETGFYVFSSIQPPSSPISGWQWVGDHIRPRIAAPESWHLPVGLSVSQEIGYQRRQFAEDSWTYELRPIIDKKIGPWYLDFNPTFDRALHGMNTGKGWGFSPNVKVSYDFTKKIAGGVEYYGALGPVSDFDPINEQTQQIFPTIDVNFSPAWEFNFGVGVDVSNSGDHLIVKCIVGRRFNWGHRRNADKPPGKMPPGK
ncbi:MAG TPA: hypothetical protein VMT67_06755 [Terriglobales bacterium]|nr:hypothetical protein [Terriglobales bacterium]